MNVGDKWSNTVFNASIRYDKYSWRGVWQFDGDSVKFLNLESDVVICLFVKGIERKTISICIYNSMTGK